MPDTKRGLKPASERPRTQSEIRPAETRTRTHIGPYQLITKIGEGGMGTVWLTKLSGPAGFNKLAVVKELRADVAGSPAFVEMFLNEARLAARLTHPNVVHTYGASEDDGRLYIAMEYLDGQPWSRVRSALWSNRSLPLAMHLKVLAEILTGLHYAHELRDYDGSALLVVHRDMSPQNTFVTYDGQVKVVDFGVARAVNSQQQDRSMFVGKVAYSAPEQLQAGAELDRRADVFAVGVMLWEALAGRRLMESQERSEAVRRRASQPAPPIRSVAPSVPRALADICDRALALDPRDRYATAAEFRDAILDHLSDTAQKVDPLQLGQLIADAFREERQLIQSLIERHLMPPSAPPPAGAGAEHLIDTVRPPPSPPPPADHHTIRADLSELASVSRLQDDDELLEASSSSAAVRMLRRRAPLALLGGAAVALGLAVWLFASLRGPQSDTVVSRPLSTAAAAASTPAAAPSNVPLAASAPAGGTPKLAQATVQLSVKATPAAATIYMDGAPLSGNPYVGRVPADGELHLIRVSAPGAQLQERVIVFDRDKALEFALAPQKSHSARSRARAAVVRLTDQPPAARVGDDVAPGDTLGRARAGADVDFGARLTPNAAPRTIYEEDPY